MHQQPTRALDLRPQHGDVIAAHLEEIAARIREANLGKLAGPVALTVLVTPLSGADDITQAIVDAVATVTGVPARHETRNSTSKFVNYTTSRDQGQAWTLSASGLVKRPASEEDMLRARVAELEAQIAAGGVR